MTVPPSRVMIRPTIGPGGVDVDVSCEVADVSINHGRADTTAQPDASTVTVAMPLGLAEGVEIGAPLYVITDIVPASYRFAGSVTDMSVSWEMRYDPDANETTVLPVARVMAAGPLADLGRRFMGDAPWPQESDGARAARILAGAAGRIQDWAYAGTAPDGWYDNWLGAVGVASITTDAAAGALRLTWLPGATDPSGFSWRYATPIRAGYTYTILAEVYVPTGQPPVQLTSPFLTAGGYAMAAERWQTVTHQFTATDNADRAIGIQPIYHPARPAGTYCLVRRFQVFESTAPVLGQIDPGTVTVLARDVDRQPALDLLQGVANDASGVAWETRAGSLCYADADHRRSIPVALELDACDVVLTPEWKRSRGGLINEVAIAYGPDQLVTTAISTVSQARYGRVAYSLQTQLAALADASAMASLLMTRNAFPVWILDAITLDLSVLDDVTRGKVLALEMHDLITITGFPAGGPLTSAALWVEGWTEELAYGRHVVVLAVSGYCRTTPPPRWNDAPPTMTWDKAGTFMFWDAACMGPSVSQGRWDDVSASQRWDQLPSADTWDTWPY